MSVTVDEAFDAIKYQDIDTLKEYLEIERTYDAKFSDILNKMFSNAVRWNNFEAMELLVSKGANPDAGGQNNLLQGKERGNLDVNNYLFNGRKFDYSKYSKDDRKEGC
jgi:hypothetical protein